MGQSRIEDDLLGYMSTSKSRIEQILNGEQIVPRSRIESALLGYNPEDPGDYILRLRSPEKRNPKRQRR